MNNTPFSDGAWSSRSNGRLLIYSGESLKADVGKAQRELDYSPKTVVSAGLANFGRWLREYT